MISKLTVAAPANEAVEYQEYNFDNMFPHKTKYRGPPTAELEAEWEKLWLCKLSLLLNLWSYHQLTGCRWRDKCAWRKACGAKQRPRTTGMENAPP